MKDVWNKLFLFLYFLSALYVFVLFIAYELIGGPIQIFVAGEIFFYVAISIGLLSGLVAYGLS
jgi:hypothetical protein